MKILIACEFSGTVRRAFAKKGHDVTSCDLLPSDDNSKDHYQGDVFDLLNNNKYDLMIAHPPCKYICLGGNNWLNRRPDLNWRGNRKLSANFFMKLINSDVPKIAVENPIGCMSTMYRKPDQIVHPYWFGSAFRKDTCLWLKGLPKLVATDFIEKPERGYKKFDVWSTKRNPDGRSLKSITYQGIADAMANQWGQ
jgi:hypothetical protein|tara:strand:- start:180 stop:764 length:585 start_codon:yes stop_codon:yes gene_type:complete